MNKGIMNKGIICKACGMRLPYDVAQYDDLTITNGKCKHYNYCQACGGMRTYKLNDGCVCDNKNKTVTRR